MEIRANSKFDFNAIRALTHLWMFKKADPKKRMIFWSICYAILLSIIIFEIIIFSADFFLFILCGLVVIFYLLLSYLYFLLPKIRYKSLAKMKDAENEYVFCDNVLKAFTKSKEYNGEAKIEYSLFVRVYETSKYLFLYQNNNQVFLVDKSSIDGGSVIDIRNKMVPFLKEKYIICNY